MKRNLLLSLLAVIASLGLQAQVTQINSNKSLQFRALLNSTKAIYVSEIDSTLWVTDGSLAGTVQISTTIKFVGELGSLSFLDGKLIFAGTTAATGVEVYVTDGSMGGTILVSDINPGPPSSSPQFDVAFMNGFYYFSARRPAEGRELWRTDGTPGGTTLVSDIMPGPIGSNDSGNYHLTSNGTYLLFAARTPSSGTELWKSTGTGAGTALLLDINTGNGGTNSSNPYLFFPFQNVVLFSATDATHGEEIWKTDGTPGGTTILKDINVGPDNSTKVTITIGPISVDLPFFNFYHVFNNRAYFTAYDGTDIGGVWSTDGTPDGTTPLKVIIPGGLAPGSFSVPLILLSQAVDLPGKFIFSVSNLQDRSELWECNGTADGTVLFKSFSPDPPGTPPFIFVPYAFNNGTVTQALFQGNKFFFMAGTAAEGTELWITDGVDGTVAHTHIVEDINPGPGNISDTTSLSYIYTSGALYFPANNGSMGPELWKSDGTPAGTDIVADIVTGAVGSDPSVNFLLVNSKILFTANNGDSPTLTDLYAVDGTFLPLPIKLRDFTVLAKSADAILNWHTSQELNSKDFTIQRSFDALAFKNIGTVAASGSTSNVHAYSFIDPGVMNSGKDMIFYRLLITDKDGKSTLSPVINLKLKNSGKWDVHLLSNPVSDNVKLVLSGITQNIQVSIIDMNGKRLYSNSLSALNGQMSIPAASLPRGRYVVVTETGNERKTIQFVK